MALNRFLRPWWWSIPPGAASIRAFVERAPSSIGFGPNSALAPCPLNPVPNKSRTSSVAAELRDKIQAQELKLIDLKAQRRQTPAKLTLKELPQAERFAQLKTEKKHFIDTIKLIAYRAESALAGEVREALARDDDARALLRRLF